MRLRTALLLSLFLLLAANQSEWINSSSTAAIQVRIDTSSFSNTDNNPFCEPNSALRKAVSNSLVEPTVFKVLVINVEESGLHNDWIEMVKLENADIVIADETGLWGMDNDSMFKEIITELNDHFTDETPYSGYTIHSQQRSSEGQAVITRFPIISAKDIPQFYADDGSIIDPYYHIIDVEINITGIITHVVGARLKCCGDVRGLMGTTTEGEMRERDHEGVVNYLDSIEGPILYGGDFNSYSPYDIGDLEASVANLGTGPISMLLNSSYPTASENHTWVDVYRETNPYEKGYTYEDWQYQSRIDYLFATDYFSDKLINSTVIKYPPGLIATDHYVLSSYFNMNPELVDLRPPIQVHNLNGSILDSNTVSLSWNPNPELDLSEYIVYRDKLELARITGTSYVDNSLIPDQLYRFTVCAVDNSSNIGLESNLLILNTSFGICTKPEAPILTVTPGIGNNTLTWSINYTGGIPLTGYQVYRIYTFPTTGYDLIHRFPTGGIHIVPPTNQYLVDTGVAPGKNYRYLVAAINELGESEKSNIASGIPLGVPTETTTTDTTPGFFISVAISSLLVIPMYVKRRKQ